MTDDTITGASGRSGRTRGSAQRHVVAVHRARRQRVFESDVPVVEHHGAALHRTRDGGPRRAQVHEGDLADGDLHAARAQRDFLTQIPRAVAKHGAPFGFQVTVGVAQHHGHAAAAHALRVARRARIRVERLHPRGADHGHRVGRDHPAVTDREDEHRGGRRERPVVDPILDADGPERSAGHAPDAGDGAVAEGEVVGGQRRRGRQRVGAGVGTRERLPREHALHPGSAERRPETEGGAAGQKVAAGRHETDR